MQPLDSVGAALDADFHVEADGEYFALIMESSSGASGSRQGRNRQYNEALRLLLTRLGSMDVTMTDALVDSRRTKQMGLPEQERRLVQVPIRLAEVPDMEALRRQMGTAQAKIGQAETATKGGNATKRIRLRLDVPGYSASDADRLEYRLANADGDAVPPVWTIDELMDKLSHLVVDRSGGQPHLYQPIVLLWAIGRAADDEPRVLDWVETRRQLEELLQRYGEQPRPHLPLAALSQAGLWQLDGPRPIPTAHRHEAQQWFAQHQPNGGLVVPAYELVRSSGEARTEAVAFLLREFFSRHHDWIDILNDVGLGGAPILQDASLTEAIADDALAAVPVSPTENEYARWCGVAEQGQKPGETLRKKGITHDVIQRLASARQAVIVRSEGHCENPDCGGEPKDVTAKGAPILEVDHVMDLALDGPDHPENMIALCPNCHAVKTRGSTREQLRSKLLVVARQRHKAVLGTLRLALRGNSLRPGDLPAQLSASDHAYATGVLLA